ncbi:D-3-hydroxyaspartate aldolase [Shimia isoporae]|uniref:3-hydroxy-D-aspartate aldolase n=1 Tax=Shimia isoporae TaxID=647720 RepID=A0A4R1NL81_9RHOB|nr:DSD1 family PLP-dependent enzyme [Shimia isoporae]TCL08865.1 D-3-hydroxyaspartate aldolase [Shimia isoporae]
MAELEELELGYDIPARVGMSEEEVFTPALVLDLDALERNISKMGNFVRAHGLRHRVHGKMHKSVDVAKLQIELGGAAGVCCQKVSEAEAFVRGGISDVLISNQVRDPRMIERLARLPKLGATVSVCIDDLRNVSELSAAAESAGTELQAFVEIDCGAGRCGVSSAQDAVEIAQAIEIADGLSFVGIQAYQGAMQHLETFDERKSAAEAAHGIVRRVLDALRNAGLDPNLVTGGGTGSFQFESASGLYGELQCGSYAFMDADYGRLLNEDGERLDEGSWENALFVLSSVMSTARRGQAVVDAGLKAMSMESGLPLVATKEGLTYVEASDEHGTISDLDNVLSATDKVRLVPGHCDPTCNLHDWYVGVRNGVVECLWPVTARGKVF